MKLTLKTLALAGLLATAGLSTFAQTPAPTDDHSAMMGEHGMRRMDPAKMQAMVAKHHAALKAKLKITPAQEPAWTAFTEAMKPPAFLQDKRQDRAALEQLSTPERIDKMHALRTQRATDTMAAMDKRDDATKTFYATLSPEQKKVFDSEHARMGQHHEARPVK